MIKEMTNAEIEEAYKNAMNQEWIETLLQLWYAYGKTPNQAQVKTYKKQLGDVTLGQLEKAVGHLLANHKFNSVPTIAEVLEAVEDTSHTATATPFRDEFERNKREWTISQLKESWKDLAVNL